MPSQPTFAEIETNVRTALSQARLALGDARDWLKSDWAPGTNPPGGSHAFLKVLTEVGNAKQTIDRAYSELDSST